MFVEAGRPSTQLAQPKEDFELDQMVESMQLEPKRRFPPSPPTL